MKKGRFVLIQGMWLGLIVEVDNYTVGVLPIAGYGTDQAGKIFHYSKFLLSPAFPNTKRDNV